MRAFLVIPKRYRQVSGRGVISPDMVVIVQSRGNNDKPYWDEVCSRYMERYSLDLKRMSINYNDFTYKLQR